MKFTLGLIAGLTVLWAAIAIYQRMPEFGPIDDEGEWR